MMVFGAFGIRFCDSVLQAHALVARAEQEREAVEEECEALREELEEQKARAAKLEQVVDQLRRKGAQSAEVRRVGRNVPVVPPHHNHNHNVLQKTYQTSFLHLDHLSFFSLETRAG